MLHADGDDDEPGVCEQPEHSDRAEAEALVKDPLRMCWPCAHAPHACFVLFCFVWLATLGMPVVAPGTAAGPFRRVVEAP